MIIKINNINQKYLKQKRWNRMDAMTVHCTSASRDAEMEQACNGAADGWDAGNTFWGCTVPVYVLHYYWSTTTKKIFFNKNFKNEKK